MSLPLKSPLIAILLVIVLVNSGLHIGSATAANPCAPPLAVASAPMGTELIVNGGFEMETELEGWNVTSLNPAVGSALFISQDNVIKRSGSNSLFLFLSLGTRTLSSISYPVTGNIFQVIEKPNLSLNLTLSFWICPNTIRDQNPYSHHWLSLALHGKVDGKDRDFTLSYHASWEGSRDWKPNATDAGDFLLSHLAVNEWNYVRRDVRKDFQSRFGTIPTLQISSAEIRISVSSKQPLPGGSIEVSQAWWDELSLVRSNSPKLKLASEPNLTYTVGIVENRLVYYGNLTASVSNMGDQPLIGVSVSLAAPKFVTSSPEVNVKIDKLEANSATNLSWTWRGLASAQGNYTFEIRASAANGDQDSQVVSLGSPDARMDVDVTQPMIPYFTPIVAKVKVLNSTGQAIVNATLDFYIDEPANKGKVASTATDQNGVAQLFYVTTMMGPHTVTIVYPEASPRAAIATSTVKVGEGLGLALLAVSFFMFGAILLYLRMRKKYQR